MLNLEVEGEGRRLRLLEVHYDAVNGGVGICVDVATRRFVCADLKKIELSLDQLLLIDKDPRAHSDFDKD